MQPNGSAGAIVGRMVPCPHCGSTNAPGQPLCARCGAQLVIPEAGLTSTRIHGSNVSPTQPDFVADPGPEPRREVAATWPDAPPLAQPPAAAPALDPKRTMVGIAPPPAAQNAVSNEPYAPMTAKRTMLGIAPPVALPAAPAPARAAQNQTLVGMAPTPAASPAQAAARAEPAPEAERRPAPMPSHHKKQTGIAHPGIAPLHPQVPKPLVSRAQPTEMGRELGAEDLAVLPGYRRRGSRSSLIVVIVLSIAVLLLSVAIVIALWWKSGAPIEARVQVDDVGRETLEVTCRNPCAYTRVAAGSVRAELLDGRAVLALAQPLAVGENRIQLELEAATGGQKTLELTVPVAYRLKIDFAGLAEPAPRVAVVVEAEPGTAVVVDGHAVALDARGRGRHAIDVSRDLTGPATKLVALEKKVPYGVTRPKAEPVRGELVLRIGVVPLSVDAPGDSIVIDSPNFTLAGRTQTGGAVSVGGRAITVDPSGRFAQLMNVSSVGETTIVVRASAPDHAPRFFPIRIRRVASLQEEAASFAQGATRSYATIASELEKKRGWKVALDGEVVESRTENHTSIILLDVSSGCARRPCLARVVHGAHTQLKPGDRISVHGQISGAVDGPRSGMKIPELRIDFLLPTKGAR
jgi:hypothetical protein